MKLPWATVVGSALGVVLGLLVGGLIFLISQQPRGKPIELLPAPTPAPLRVHVTGAVAHPGVVVLAPGARVENALEEAGGMLPEADAGALNLAAFVQDGAQINVPLRGTNAPSGTTRAPSAVSGGMSVDINKATPAELEALPGIGKVTAGRIVEYRNTNGPFTDLEQILNVPGIGQDTYEKIKPFITLNP